MSKMVEDLHIRADIGPKIGARRARLAHSRIGAIQGHVTGEPVSSAELEASLGLDERFGMEPGALERVTGISTRYRVDDKRVRPHDLAHDAARKALAQADIDPQSLDTIIFASVTRDYLEPASAHLVQEKLGASNAFVFDISNACLGIINGVLVLDSLIAAGRCRTGLVCGGEVSGPYFNASAEKIRQAESIEDLYPHYAMLTVGDAGAAIVVEPKEEESPARGFVAFEFASRSQYHDLCVVPILGDEPTMLTDSSRVIEAAAMEAVEVLDRLLEKSDWTRDDIDLVIPHQVSRPANIMTISERCGIPEEKMVMTVESYGNTASTALPLALSHAIESGRLQPGMKVWLAGFGSGISFGFASMVW